MLQRRSPLRAEIDHDFYERIVQPLEIEDDAEIHVVEEEDSEQPWTTPPKKRPDGRIGETPQER